VLFRAATDADERDILADFRDVSSGPEKVRVALHRVETSEHPNYEPDIRNAPLCSLRFPERRVDPKSRRVDTVGHDSDPVARETIRDSEFHSCMRVGDNQVGEPRQAALEPVGETMRPIVTPEIHVRRADAPDEFRRRNGRMHESCKEIGTSNKAVEDVGPCIPDCAAQTQQETKHIPAAALTQLNKRHPRVLEFRNQWSIRVEQADGDPVASLLQAARESNELPLRSAKIQGSDQQKNRKRPRFSKPTLCSVAIAHRRLPSEAATLKELLVTVPPFTDNQMFSVPYLNELRIVEMERLVPYIPAGARVLEFGAGTGQQARFLADRGFDVVAVDLADSTYSEHLVFPVRQYDGEHLPLDSVSIDVIFSSNVLEHVENVPAIMNEFRRILRPSGIGIHVMPTPAWRFWTFVSGLGNSAVTATRLPAHLIKPPAQQSRWRALTQGLRTIAAGLLPLGHGTSAEGISELYTFSRRAWLNIFDKYGFDVVEDRPMGLFYTGNMLFGRQLSFSRRAQLSRSLGSATRIYIVKPRGSGA